MPPSGITEPGPPAMADPKAGAQPGATAPLPLGGVAQQVTGSAFPS